jgi:hypothetical protein
LTNNIKSRVRYLNDNISVIPTKKQLYSIASVFVISPVTNGRVGLFILSISTSNISFIIILLDIIVTALNELTINLWEVNRFLMDGFTIHPPVKHKNNVGIIFCGLIIFINPPAFVLIIFICLVNLFELGIGSYKGCIVLPTERLFIPLQQNNNIIIIRK